MMHCHDPYNGCLTCCGRAADEVRPPDDVGPMSLFFALDPDERCHGCERVLDQIEAFNHGTGGRS